jgi:hypothetical protein
MVCSQQVASARKLQIDHKQMSPAMGLVAVIICSVQWTGQHHQENCQPCTASLQLAAATMG